MENVLEEQNQFTSIKRSVPLTDSLVTNNNAPRTSNWLKSLSLSPFLTFIFSFVKSNLNYLEKVSMCAYYSTFKTKSKCVMMKCGCSRIYTFSNQFSISIPTQRYHCCNSFLRLVLTSRISLTRTVVGFFVCSCSKQYCFLRRGFRWTGRDGTIH